MPKHAATRRAKPLITPHDRRQPINRAPSPRWVENFRELIRSNDLIVRLQTFALDDPDNPTSIRMTRTQAMVALSMLRKVLPDMQAIEITGEGGAPIQIQVLRFSDVEADEAPKSMITIDNFETDPRLIEDEPIAVSPRRTRGRKQHQ